MPSNRSIAGWIVALLLLSGCAGKTSTFAELGPEGNTKGFGELYPPDETEGKFTFGVGDTVGVLVQNNTDFTGSFVVRLDGKITMNIIGDVLIAGLTPDQVRHKLESKIAVYMKDIAITVTAVTIVSKRYYVAATNPLTGGYIVKALPYKGDTTLFEVWASMGSPSTTLDDDAHMKVIRPDPRHPVVKVINIREMLTCGYSGGNIQIKPNDIVYVPPTFWGRVNQLFTALVAPFTGFFATVNQFSYFANVVGGNGGNRYGGHSVFNSNGGLGGSGNTVP